MKTRVDITEDVVYYIHQTNGYKTHNTYNTFRRFYIRDLTNFKTKVKKGHCLEGYELKFSDKNYRKELITFMLNLTKSYDKIEKEYLNGQIHG